MIEDRAGEAAQPAVRRPAVLRAGILFVLVGCYLVFLPLAVWSFVDPKLLCLTVGTALIWWYGLPLTRRPGIAAGVLAGVLIVADVVGVAPLDGLLGVRFASTGLVLLLPCLFLIAVLPSIPADVRDRLPLWLTWLGLAVAAVAIIGYLTPGAQDSLGGLGLVISSDFASTTGHSVFTVALLSVSLAAALSRLRPEEWSTWAAAAVIALGLALPHESSSYLLAVLVVGTWLWKARPMRRTALRGLIVVGLAFVLSLGITAAVQESRPVVGSGPATPASVSTIQNRLTAWRVALRATADRPLLGWGTDAGLSGYMANVTPEELASQAPERSWWDVHDIFLQFLLTTGVVGLLALCFVLAETVPSALAAPRDLSWASSAVVALSVYFLYQPLSVAVLPVFAVVLGVATRPRCARTPGRGPRVVVGGTLAICVVLAALSLAQSVTFQWALRHESDPALAMAAALIPWRTEPQWWIARFDDPVAANERMSSLVRANPWDTELRLSAAWVASQTGRLDLADAYLSDHLQLFPADRAWVQDVRSGRWPP